jgi:hypothetical protein
MASWVESLVQHLDHAGERAAAASDRRRVRVPQRHDPAVDHHSRPRHATDDGVGAQTHYSSPGIQARYPPLSGGWNNFPAGGFGGLGIVELMAPIGTIADGTNTVLDDHIDVVRNGQRLVGAEKQRYLAWRGYENAIGVPTGIGENEGDIRPAPILLPLLR